MTEDESVIRQVVQRLEAAWNAADGAGFGASFTEDADFVNILGAHHTGRAAIAAGHEEILRTIYRGSRVSYTVERVRFIRPEVAVAFLRARLVSFLAVAPDDPRRASLGGASPREDVARPTMVLVKDRGTWKIVVFQNTRVAESTQ